MIKSYLVSFLFLIIILPFASATQLQADAGNDRLVCPGNSTTIGGSPSARYGLPPYTYSWSPATGLSSTAISNPTVVPTGPTNYTLTVTDDTGAVATDIVLVNMSAIYYQNAGSDITICKYEQIQLGGIYNSTGSGVSFAWTPAGTLNDSTLPRPTCQPLETTTYAVTINQSGCTTKVNTVTVTVIDLHVSAGDDVIIDEGQTITLHATGAINYVWNPPYTLTYPNTADPDAEPKDTTMYYVTGYDINYQCSNKDTVIVYVKKGDNVYFYNTFTPNGDGNNDTWYVGNIYKYPNNSLDIYNRNSKLVFHSDSYLNTWDGKSFGQDLPAATYFYVLDLGDGSDKMHGTVTIIR